ncbi:MAP7 domain-containing protein 2-like [Rhipicephalus sanguineus]|uniref:MAP7 domain-containing protein 2-like n=1 Tax=Rhipicephalus sanguineus TaxID=34632 RepID=UPI0018935E28|nr:MAP7 domain-containing protein 2-like [Rhipicephalus sanguineus]
MAAGRDHAYRNKGGHDARAEADRKHGDEGVPGAERRRHVGNERGTDARLNAELEETRTIAEEGDRHSDSSSDRPRGRDRGHTRDSGHRRDGRSKAEGAESRSPRRYSRQGAPTTERARDEPGHDYDANVADNEERPPSRSKEKAHKPVATRRETRRLNIEKYERENLHNRPRPEPGARKSKRKEPSTGPPGREGNAEKAVDDARESGNRKDREVNALTKLMKAAAERRLLPPESTKDLGPAKQMAEEKGPDKTPVAVAEETLEDEDKYSTGSEDYYEEVTEEVVEPDPYDWRQGRGGLVTRRTTRSTTKKRKYGKPGARKSGEQPSSKHTPTTASEKKQRDDEIDAEKKNGTTTSEADELFPPAQDTDDKETGTCPCCGSCWPSHMDESRMKATQGQSKTWRRRMRRGDEGPAGDEWYEVRNFGPKQTSRPSKRRTEMTDTTGRGLQGGVQFADRMPYPYAFSSATPPPYSAQQLYPPGAQGPDVYYNAYQPNLQGPYQRPPLCPGPAAFPQAYPMPPAAMGSYGAAVQANSTTAFPAATGGCATCHAQALLGQLSLGGGQPVPTMSVEDFLRRERRVRQEERLRLEEKQLREEKLRREERVRQEERLRREERARKEERRRRELEEERLRQEERLRIEERIREEQRLSLEARLEEQRRERIERQRRERIEEQRRYNDSLRRALAEMRMATDRGAGAAPPPSSFLDEVLIRGRLRPVPSSVLSRAGSLDRLRASALRDPRDSERPTASIRGISRPARWDDVHRYTEKTRDPRDNWGPPSRGGGRFR